MPLRAIQDFSDKILPMVWKTPTTGELSFQVHGCGTAEILIDPLPADAASKGALYSDGAHLMDLEEVRELLYKMQRPAIAPQVRLIPSTPPPPTLTPLPPLSLSRLYPHDWNENNPILFNNGGVMQSVVGALGPDQVRVFHQCNLAGSDDPAGPSAEDVRKWA
ncbi:hypothetical protein DFH09DRAFT_1331507 [Mycena vulgaris]|nr:hypothetical protein DFH09DRAFT_1331507 [Mycena vulgaris]